MVPSLNASTSSSSCIFTGAQATGGRAFETRAAQLGAAADRMLAMLASGR